MGFPCPCRSRPGLEPFPEVVPGFFGTRDSQITRCLGTLPQQKPFRS